MFSNEHMVDEIAAIQRSPTAYDYICPAHVLLPSPPESLKPISAAVQHVTVEGVPLSPPLTQLRFAVVE